MSPAREAVRAACIWKSPPDEGQILRGQFIFPEESPVFAGHFPDHPVLPAVIQTLMALLLLEEKGTPARLLSVAQAKYLFPVSPGVAVTLTVSPLPGENRWRCLLCTESGETVSRFDMETAQ